MENKNVDPSMLTQKEWDTITAMTAVTLTFGEKLVGLNFNPSNDDSVSKAKRLCADLADLLYNEQKNSETSELKNILLPAAYAQILNAQMNVVKVLTLRY
jgi:hypothetical protein